MPEEVDAPILCVGCGAGIEEEESYFRLVSRRAGGAGCRHVMCCGCFAASMAQKGCSLSARCPGVDCPFTSMSWAHHRPVDGLGRPDPKVHRARRPTADHGLLNHPTQYYLHQPELYKKNHTLLTINTFNFASHKDSCVIQAEIPTNPDHITEETKMKLNGIGQYLHPLLVPMPEVKPAQSAFSGGMQTIEAIDRESDSALRHMLHGIGTGHPVSETRYLAETKASGVLHQRELNKTMVATDLIQTTKGSRRGSLLMTAVSNQLTIGNASDSVLRFFSRLGLSRGKQCIDFGARKAVLDKIQNGIPGGIEGRRFELIANTFDNIGAKGRPDKKRKVQHGLLARAGAAAAGAATGVTRGYVQFTTSILKFVSVDQLVKWGIYPDPDRADPENATCASRYRKSWEEERESYDFDIKRADTNILLEEIVLPHANGILSLLKSGQLPGSLEEAKNWLASNESVEFDCDITRRVGSRVRVERAEDDGQDDDVGETLLSEDEVDDADELDDHFADEDALAGGTEDDMDDGEQGEERPRTIFEANNMCTDIPWEVDLNSSKTCQSIATYTRSIADAMLRDEDENPWDDWPEELQPAPILEHTGPVLLGDGAPIFAMLRLKYTKLRETLFWPVFGGFHLLLELHKKRGKMFGPTHLRKLISAHRNTPKMQDWFLDPGDPTQADDESIPIYFGTIAAAVFALKRKRATEGGSMSVSAIDLVEHMLAVERFKPATRIVMMDLRFLEVIFLLHLAEETGKSKLFVAGMKFCSILFAVTHATKYIFMLAKFFIFWHCGSEAEKILFERCCLVQRTVSGKTVYTDRFFEWYQKFLRSRVGKHFNYGFDTRIVQHALTAPEQGIFKFLIDGDSNNLLADDPTLVTRFAKIYCETVVFFEERKLFDLDGDGSLGLLRSEDGTKQVNPQILRIDTIGPKRLDNYMATYESASYKSGAERSDKIVDLSMVQPTLEKRQNQDSCHRLRLVSTMVSVVQKAYNKPELESEYAKTLEEFKSLDIEDRFPARNRGQNNKEHYAASIVAARKILQEADDDWNANRLAAFDQNIQERDTNERDQLENDYSEISGGLFVTLGMSHTSTANIRARYNQVKYDLSSGGPTEMDVDTDSDDTAAAAASSANNQDVTLSNELSNALQLTNYD